MYGQVSNLPIYKSERYGSSCACSSVIHCALDPMMLLGAVQTLSSIEVAQEKNQ